MPDAGTLDLGGGGQQKGVPSWVMIVGAVAGVVGLVLLLKNQQGQGTVAAGSSINAALGSIQSEVLNAQGQLSQQNMQVMANQNTINQNVQGASQSIISGIDLNRMVLSQMPGGQNAYWNVIGSESGAAAFSGEYGVTGGMYPYWPTQGPSSPGQGGEPGSTTPHFIPLYSPVSSSYYGSF